MSKNSVEGLDGLFKYFCGIPSRDDLTLEIKECIDYCFVKPRVFEYIYRNYHSCDPQFKTRGNQTKKYLATKNYAEGAPSYISTM